MRRKIEQQLTKWKDDPDRYPIIIRGARQVGKSYTIENFGKQCFTNSFTVNFELDENAANYFNYLEPKTIIEQLEIYFGERIIPGETLLFLDEIQCCPRAILSLRYFKEKLPKLHVIAAGSLLEFTLNDENFSFPVGRVQFMYLHPLSFEEFLDNIADKLILDKLHQVSINSFPSQVLHDKLLGYLRTYMLTGGMPAVVKKYISSNSLLECHRIQKNLVEAYKDDFGKYATSSQHKYLKKTFARAPHLVAQQLKYVKIDPEIKSMYLKTAVEQLEYAGLISKIYVSSASGIPIHANIKDNFYKLLYLDVGLLQSELGIDPKQILDNDVLQINKGAIAEQFVGQELKAYQGSFSRNSLCYWSRDKKSSTAEIDYLFEVGGNIFPIEVKAGKTGRMKSLQIFMQEKNSIYGITISQNQMSFQKNILNLPLYLIFKMEKIINGLLK